MRKSIGVFILFFLLPFASAQVDNYNNVSSLTVSIDVSSDIQKTQGTVQEISAELEFYPKEYTHQTILSEQFISNPDAEVSTTDAGVKFLWNRDSSLYSYSASSVVQVENTLVKIYERIPYPAPVPQEVQVYTLETEIIDITPEIDALGEELVGGEDDMYKAVFILANWTQNTIEYNLSTLNVQASLKSSEVLERKEGVCDELTNLFISLARSRGIPARFVSGMVYSNLNYNFGAHGWAEVYIDGQWIPVDVTYGTFGWVDPSHVKFKDELGSNEASVAYEWIGSHVAVETGEIDFITEVLDQGGVAEEYLNMHIEALQESVGPGSYVPIQITVSNPNDFYVPVQLYLTKAPGVLGKNTKSLLLEPGEEKSAFWIVEVPENIDSSFLYTTIIEVQTMYGGYAQTDFSYAASYEDVTLDDAETIISSLVIDEEKPYLDDVGLDCSLDKENYYQKDSALLTCSLEGNLQGVEVCFSERCFAAEEELQWAIDLQEYSSQRLMVSAERNGEARYAYFDLHIVKIPNLRIEHIEPQAFDFADTEEFTFTLATDSPIENIFLTIDNVGTFSLNTLEGEKDITTNIEGKSLATGEMIFFMEYTDALGKEYTSEQRETIHIENVPWYYSLWLSFLGFFE